ncbi:hypothetical protein VD0002_g7776 [Verticillium dahliae]|uniref:Calcofluor white hypersensitive protein n=2 Tax=Verticillium dahliae TaxID=27337 RepID=G2WR30_VERDV|nr:uncharacterized protein VDAG_00013 [Verticillium dahliae VdLs.17]KAF3345249.1 hypothetical protein VdG2_06500 [Verticillium dahliae VDG2]KAH6709770.1 hypothetical protein EV126DRAFT_2647 [Verticillium dahliae]EGY13331.1 hypothetical protein VDAG_00013 [Verticillium dahliae VdLs.17]PNH29626.1 hypothetical protein BJF96_g7012 [Verticillium dahliae]PNH50715.1 hypothetical protein VD0003_g6480 [Verticillium dahliae]
MSKSKAPLAIGLTAAGGIGYYLFAAGGSPKVAEKKAEADAHRAAASIKSHLPGRDVGAQGTLGDAAARTGAKIDHAAAEADKQFGIAKSNAEAFAKDAKAETLKSINEFDHKVENKASEVKKAASSWFSSGNKP